MDFQRFTLDLPDGPMAGLRFGAGGPPDLVLLHATGFNAMTYRSLLAPLGARWRVVALDLRGHGLTGLPADPATLSDWDYNADDTLAALAALDARAPVLSGHSMGGATAAMVAARWPDAVDRLVLLDPVLPPLEWAMRARGLDLAARLQVRELAIGALKRRNRFASREAARDGYRGRGAFATWGGDFLEDYLLDGLRPAGDGDGLELTCAPAWEASVFASPVHDGAALLGAVGVPVHLLRAERGPAAAITPDPSRPRHAPLTIETPPDATHFLPMEMPDLVRVRLEAALEARRLNG